MIDFYSLSCQLGYQWLFHCLVYLLKILLKLKCRNFKKNNNWKKYFMILNSNSNLGIKTMEFQILDCIRRPKQGILKSIDFKLGHFKSIGSK